MSKRKKEWWRKKKTPLIVELQKVARESNDINHRRDAQSFCDYFVRTGRLTHYMKVRGRELADINLGKNRHKKKGKVRWGEHYLYAITDGESIKVGFSVDPKKRLKQMSTSSYKPLKLVWQVLCGYNDKHARKEEAKIHRKLKPHNIKNEWFKYDCLLICRMWRVRNMEEKYKNYLNYLEYDEPEKFNDLIDERLDAELLKLYSNL